MNRIVKNVIGTVVGVIGVIVSWIIGHKLGSKARTKICKEDFESFQEFVKEIRDKKMKEHDELNDKVNKLFEEKNNWEDQEAWEDEKRETIAMRDVKSGEVTALQELIDMNIIVTDK